MNSNRIDNETISSTAYSARPQFSYDANGNLLSDGIWDYSWDEENRILSMWSTMSIQSTNHIKIKNTYDDQDLICELTVDCLQFTDRKDYTYGIDLSGSLQDAGGVGGVGNTDDPFWPHNGPTILEPEIIERDKKKKCKNWIKQELEDMDWLKDIPCCPKKIEKKDGCWKKPDGDWTNPEKAGKYHPNANQCIRSKNNKTASGQQCCYNDNGDLLPNTNSSAGTADKVAPTNPATLLRHLSSDVYMFDYCSSFLGEKWITEEYFKVRPPNHGGGCKCAK